MIKRRAEFHSEGKILGVRSPTSLALIACTGLWGAHRAGGHGAQAGGRGVQAGSRGAQAGGHGAQAVCSSLMKQHVFW